MSEAIIYKILALPGIIIALSFHEFAHAKIADYLGDPTPGEQGRLTLNPLPHLDPIGFLMLMFASFGWAKPVLISPWKFKRDITMKKGMLMVALAGPAMNLLLAIAATLILRLYELYYFSPNTEMDWFIYYMILYLLRINIVLAIFNLIPVPPLDGSKILAG